VGPGVALLIIGAILAFAVRKEMPAIDIQTVGVILMIGGIALIVHARIGDRREHEVTRVEEPDDPTQPTHTVRETHTDRDIQ
jgi:uncharacterized membrane protein HdeD (DUF308 family)